MSRTVPIPLPMLPPGTTHVPCTECGKCCTYVSVGINAPHSLRYASDALWYLYHESVSIHRDGDGDWSVVFETRCRHLGADRLCHVYAQRPIICREFDDTTCEVNSPEGGMSFETPEAFLRWLRGRRPRLYKKLLERHVPDELRRAVYEPALATTETR